MPNVIQFTPRPRAPLPPVLPPLAGTGLRPHLEEAAQTALDAADKIIAALDRLGGTGEAGASLTAMAAHAGQVVNLREAPAPVEADPTIVPTPEPEPIPQEVAQAEPEAPEAAPEEIATPEFVYEPIRLPWRGAGNVVSAAGCAVLSLVVGMR